MDFFLEESEHQSNLLSMLMHGGLMTSKLENKLQSFPRILRNTGRIRFLKGQA